MDPFLILVAVAAVILSLAVLYRRRHGFGVGETISSDDMTLRSERYGLIGRPDRIVRRGRRFIPEDKKSSNRLYDSHRLQMGVYMLLVEEHFGVRPPHAVLVLGDGRRERIANSKKLRRRVLEIAERIRQGHSQLHIEQRALASPGKCRACGQRENCTQRVA